MSNLIIDTDMTEKPKVEFIKISDLDSKPNFVIGAIVDENGVMQIIVNTNDEGRLWATFHRIEEAIKFVLQQAEIRRRASGVQAAPASVLDKLRG
jgi:hypothetical protein